MAIKSDKWIKRMSLEYDMIRPFEPDQIREGIISFGLSSYGYDIRLSNKFKVLNPDRITILDPKNFDQSCFLDLYADHCLIPANSFILAQTIEYFKIPRHILTICFGKSTYARCGIIVNVTPFEPEWEGYATLAISNTSSKPVKIYADEGIAQLIFLESDEECEVSYADKKGKYQTQKEITLSRI